MKTSFAVEALPKSIFLAGPTPRDAATPSWRPEALQILENDFHFNGTVYVPEDSNWTARNSYDDQLSWEWEAMSISTVILFWVPRNLDNMPAFTTNVEFGLQVMSGKCVLGYPADAPKLRYLDALGRRYNVPIAHTLQDTIWMALNHDRR